MLRNTEERRTGLKLDLEAIKEGFAQSGQIIIRKDERPRRWGGVQLYMPTTAPGQYVRRRVRKDKEAKNDAL